MNAQTASKLMLHEIVMMNNDPKLTGTVREIDPINRKVLIDWKYYKRPVWHKMDEMTYCERWQPTEDQITDAIMEQQAGDE